MTKMKLKSDFEYAQHPSMWAAVAKTLADNAHPIFYAAVEQKKRYDEATDRAWAEADRRYAQNPNQAVSVDIDCEAPAFLPAFLLYGFAVENLLKGVYVSNNAGAIHEQRLQIPTIHDLPELAKAAGFSPAPAETELLILLSTVTIWLGRYPVARTRQQHGCVGLDREGFFDDPEQAGIASHDLIRKLQGWLDNGMTPRSKGGAVIVGLKG
jgi:hypothetical protein